MDKMKFLFLILILAIPFIVSGCGATATLTAGKPSASALASATAAISTAPLPAATPIPTAVGKAPDTPDDCEKISYTQKADKADYMYMYFRDLSANRNLYIKSGRYGLSFDTTKAAVNKFGLCLGSAEQDKDNASQIIEAMPSASSSLTVDYNGKSYAKLTGGGADNYKLIRSGSVLQSFGVNKIKLAEIPALDIRLEVNAAPNQIAVLYDLFSESDINALGFTYRFDTGDPALTVSKWYNNDENSGILTLSNESGTKNITFVAPLRDDGTRDKLALVSDGVVQITASNINVKGLKQSKARNRTEAVGLLILPNLAEPEKAVHYTENVLAEKGFLSVKGIAPYTKDCKLTYDGMRGIYSAELLSIGLGNAIDTENTMLERLSLLLSNKYNYDIKATLMFTHKRGNIVWAVGSVGMIRDTAGNPTGLPVQLSKNWHFDDEVQLYDGQWQEYYAQLTLPAYKKVEYEFTVAGSKWGSAYTASHAQLCLIGWSKGMASLWEQCALSNYTETICYYPESPNFTQDVRGLLFNDNGTAPNGFNSNVGGGSFLYYVDSRGSVIPVVDMKIRYYDLGPNLTYVTYSGVTSDGKIRANYTTRVQRSNDLCRIYHSFDYQILQNITNAKVLAFYQYGADGYNESAFTSFAYGNKDGVTRALNQTELGQGMPTTKYQYVNGLTNIKLTGETPWLSWLGRNSGATDGFGLGDKALIVRDWRATIGGVQSTSPYLEVRSACAAHQGSLPTNIMELGAGKKSLAAGDKISGTVEIMVLPPTEKSYTGYDAQFKAAVKQYAGSWKFALYEAAGNDIKVDGLKDMTLVSSHPTALKAKTGAEEMYFTIHNGISYVPVSIENIPSYDGWDLQEYTGGKWVSIRESQEVNGGDYSQCRYCPETDTYILTYNVYRDSGVSASAQYRLVKLK